MGNAGQQRKVTRGNWRPEASAYGPLEASGSQHMRLHVRTAADVLLESWSIRIRGTSSSYEECV